MRGFFLVLWLLVPVGAAADHYGPGKEQLSLDDAGAALRLADAKVADQQWSAAIDAYDEALKNLPADRVSESRRIRLERAKAQMMAKKLPFAHQELLALVDEVKDSGDAELVSDTQSSLASAQYYMTWLMRLEGRPPAEWEPEIEAARQTYKQLVDRADKQGDAKSAAGYRDDLEAAIRLARMDLAELQALPLKSQCQGCCSGDCKGNGLGKGKGKGKGQQNKSENPNRGAGGEMPPDTRGH
jgi:tetratricopeptide (TPR) repeat protein